ncbi:MAG: substrate-binding domain-containing protein [Treponema sp.]|jgi:D-xylose transport system substrate-binding protein|nr:substrate-binding domain-containing protein [Treponema sp.]
MIRRIFPALPGLILAGILCSACIQKAQHDPGDDRIIIGFVMDSFIEERWSRDRDIFISTARRLGAEVILQAGDGDSQNQEAQIHFLLEKGINVLVLVASDPRYLAKTIQEVKRQGIPVLLYERLVFDAGADLYLAYDGEAAGELQAQAVLDRIPAEGSAGTRRVLIYNGTAGDTYAEAVHRGIMNVLKEPVRNKRISIAADYWPASPDSGEAFDFMNRFLNDHAAVDGVVAVNDLAAEAIIRALAIKRLAGKTAVAGADADLAACQRIAEGAQTMTVYKPIEYIAASAAQMAIYLAKDDRFTIHNAINDGSYRVPYYKLNPVAVNASNMDETVIRDGFHLREDIYRNVFP